MHCYRPQFVRRFRGGYCPHRGSSTRVRFHLPTLHTPLNSSIFATKPYRSYSQLRSSSKWCSEQSIGDRIHWWKSWIQQRVGFGFRWCKRIVSENDRSKIRPLFPIFLSDFNRIWTFRQSFLYVLNRKFNENPSIASRAVRVDKRG